MEARITSTVAARQFSDLLNRVRYRKERFIIERGGEAIADLVPHVLSPGVVSLSDLAALILNAPSPDDTFAADLDEVQASQPPAGDEPWPSL